MRHLKTDTLLQGGKYRVTRFLGNGGFGCTYEAHHVMFDKRVAIKEFFMGDYCTRNDHTGCVAVGIESKRDFVEKLKQKFIDEARTISNLSHTGIVHVIDVFEENDTAYYVMDYIEGCSLAEIIRRQGKLPEHEAVGYVAQVSEALRYIHNHHHLHLDVKPANIMIDPHGRAVLIDFGTSKFYDEEFGDNTSTLLSCSPSFAPLEQINQDVTHFLPATDIYALGTTLYTCLTGIPPLSANLLASGDPLPPLPRRISTSTRLAVEAAMQTKKQDRPQSIDAFLAILRPYDDRGWLSAWRSRSWLTKSVWLFVTAFLILSGIVMTLNRTYHFADYDIVYKYVVPTMIICQGVWVVSRKVGALVSLLALAGFWGWCAYAKVARSTFHIGRSLFYATTHEVFAFLLLLLLLQFIFFLLPKKN